MKLTKQRLKKIIREEIKKLEKTPHLKSGEYETELSKARAERIRQKTKADAIKHKHDYSSYYGLKKEGDAEDKLTKAKAALVKAKAEREQEMAKKYRKQNFKSSGDGDYKV